MYLYTNINMSLIGDISLYVYKNSQLTSRLSCATLSWRGVATERLYEMNIEHATENGHWKPKCPYEHNTSIQNTYCC